MTAPGWQIAIDTGGSFTDCLAQDPHGRVRSCKVLSSSALRVRIARRVSSRVVRVEAPSGLPDRFFVGYTVGRLGEAEGPRVLDAFEGSARLHLDEPIPPDWTEGSTLELQSPEEAPLLAARVVTATPLGRPLPRAEVRLATTRGTNALLTRTGAPTVLFVTEGFGDLLTIGTQQRPDLFSLDIRRPPPLVDRVVEVRGRLAADGSEIQAMDPGALEDAIQLALDDGIECAAIALLHSPVEPDHEDRLAERLLAAGFRHVRVSHRSAARTGYLARAQTTVVDATLSPLIDDYLQRIRTGLGGASLHLMTSAGGVVAASAFHARDSLLSGPAGGVVGAATWARRAGRPAAIAFDMGGTSTDVSRVGGDHTYQFEHTVGDATLLAPALSIHTVAAGGGSICDVQHGRLQVGPGSAGARPGPACYGLGGPLTLSDVNLLLGRLQPERFPIPILPDAARAALAAVRGRLPQDPPLGDEALLEGFLRIANERMADAIRQVSLRRGYDPTDHALVSFGGAGGQHAADVATMLGIRTVLVPPRASLLSAEGLSQAVIERFAERQLLRDLEASLADLEPMLEALERDATARVEAEGIPAAQVKVARRLAELRFQGQDSSLDVDIYGVRALPHSFRRAYQDLFGHVPRGRAIEVVSLRVVARGPAPRLPAPEPPEPRPDPPARSAWFDGWRQVPTLDRNHLRDATVPGPLLVEEESTVVVVPPGWSASLDDSGAIRLDATDDIPGGEDDQPWAVRRELFAHRLEGIAREMGELLRRTAVSTNVKERLDFSCTLLDPAGRLVVNAPHIPVHLGAMGLCVREVVREHPLQPGDILVTNHPRYGGSHLPDVTVLRPVDLDGVRVGYVAARAHHAELGGISPGSMPASATRLVEEGVVLPPTLLARGGEPDWETVERLLREAPHPTRSPEDNLADLRAMVAACRRGADALTALAMGSSAPAVGQAMDDLRADAASRLRGILAARPDGTVTAHEELDDGTPLQVTVRVEGDRAALDFEGTGARHPGNLNATPAIVHSAVLYVLRLLVREPLPLNEGLLEAVDLRIPRGLLDPGFPLDPAECPAVVGGNVETSQRLVDTLVRAFGLLACGQGTMNNLTFGNPRYGYYETVAGGAGAGPGFDGASGVHTHMTNTRITDPEVLETRYPVRMWRFALRPGSGGAGRYRGGDGIERELEFLEAVRLSLLSQHRVVAPFGLEGGGDGARGEQYRIHGDGTREPVPGMVELEMAAGERFLLRTPGGGGWGAPE